ncbi:unnamed protein product [Rotaria sp. Silwood1]|nr:unnamed protein product [Rotaria sp. Silwood1]CAF1210725.1 unnamed protein product [Rotaria sp. Silwood1]CAF4906579.1 unnamed protein product [Rotaria sp. Silwood1]
MNDLIKSDIEKIEQALNICIDDVGIDIQLNDGYGQCLSMIFIEEQIQQGNIDSCYRSVKNLIPIDHRIDKSSLIQCAAKVNLCYQKNLFELLKYCQSIVIIPS